MNRHIYKFLLFIYASVFILIGCANNQSSNNNSTQSGEQNNSSKFEGIITYKVVCDDPNQPKMNKDYRGFTEYIKYGEKDRGETQIGNIKISIISNRSSEDFVELMEFNDKQYEVMQDEKMENAYRSTITLLNDTKEINGYTCKYARLVYFDSKGNKCTEEDYYSEQLPSSPFRAWKGLNGLPLQSIVTNENGMTLMVTVQSISEQALPDSLFEVSSNYRIMRMDEIIRDIKEN